MHTDYTAHRFVHDFACASLDVDAILPVLRTCFEVIRGACPPQLSTGARFQSEELKLPNVVGWESDPVTRAIEPIRTLLTPSRAEAVSESINEFGSSPSLIAGGLSIYLAYLAIKMGREQDVITRRQLQIVEEQRRLLAEQAALQPAFDYMDLAFGRRRRIASALYRSQPRG